MVRVRMTSGDPATSEIRSRSPANATPSISEAAGAGGHGETELWRGRLARLVPGRSAHIPASWAANVDPGGPDVTVAVE